jgi:uncharacterized protein (UPF0264 family)
MQLLVSVRSPDEALAALEGGAALIDVKEPANGSLGRAADGAIAAVIRAVAGRQPVSAALGELLREPAPYPGAGLAYVKWGLAGCGRRPGWQQVLAAGIAQVERRRPPCQVVTAAYADWEPAEAPPLNEVIAFAHRRPGSALLLDTFQKGDGRTLLDWLPLPELMRACRRCRAAGIRVALAGSLGPKQIRRLLPVRPDWFAVRGSVCTGEDRRGTVSADAVRGLVALLGGIKEPTHAS